MAQCNLAGPGSAVRLIVGQVLINIYNRKEARRERDLFLVQAIDTTVRGLIYEANGTVTPSRLLSDGERMLRSHCEMNAIPAAVLESDPREPGIMTGSPSVATAPLR